MKNFKDIPYKDREKYCISPTDVFYYNIYKTLRDNSTYSIDPIEIIEEVCNKMNCTGQDLAKSVSIHGVEPIVIGERTVYSHNVLSDFAGITMSLIRDFDNRKK